MQMRAQEPIARAMGFFSLGLGTAQVLTPRLVNFVAGLDNRMRHRVAQRAVGVRELAAAGGLMSERVPARWMWARVAGDGMDLAMLASALSSPRNKRVRTTLAAASVAGVTALDVVGAMRATRAQNLTADGALRAKSAITVRQSPAEVYRFWRDVENFPLFMEHVVSVTTTSDTRSHWVATAPAGALVEWDAEILEDVPERTLAWGSVAGTGVDNSGIVRFRPAPGDQGTEVTVELEYKPPAGTLGEAVAMLFGEAPRQQLRDDLRRFKQAVETGDIARSDGSPEGVRAARQLRQRVAQPVG
jgi:uncharacterized membrane protein